MIKLKFGVLCDSLKVIKITSGRAEMGFHVRHTRELAFERRIWVRDIESYRRHITSFVVHPTTSRPTGPSCDLKIAKLFPRILYCFHIGNENQRKMSQKIRAGTPISPHTWATRCSLQGIFRSIGLSDSYNLFREVEQVFSSPFFRWESWGPSKFPNLNKYPVGVKAMSPTWVYVTPNPDPCSLCSVRVSSWGIHKGQLRRNPCLQHSPPSQSLLQPSPERALGHCSAPSSTLLTPRSLRVLRALKPPNHPSPFNEERSLPSLSLMWPSSPTSVGQRREMRQWFALDHKGYAPAFEIENFF